MTAAPNILIVEDEAPLRMALQDAFEAEGFLVRAARDGEEGLDLALREDPDVILLDLMLPKRDGFSVLKALRDDRLTTPIIILSARGEEWDRIHGFEVGADDYLVKPYSARELVLRVRAVLARAEGGTPGLKKDGGRARFGDISVDFSGYSLTRDGEKTGLSRREMELLRFLLDHEGEAVSRERILDAVWGEEEFPSTRTIDTFVRRLRKKIEVDADRPTHLLTVHGVGYKFER